MTNKLAKIVNELKVNKNSVVEVVTFRSSYNDEYFNRVTAVYNSFYLFK